MPRDSYPELIIVDEFDFLRQRAVETIRRGYVSFNEAYMGGRPLPPIRGSGGGASRLAIQDDAAGAAAGAA